MNYKNIFRRYELKYIITKNQEQKLFKIMSNHMNPDKYGKNTICNIYYDTPNKLIIRRSLESPCYKEKLRVRSYGVASKDSPVFIEIKKKYDGVVYKRRISMTEEEATNYLTKGIEIKNKTQISKEIDYFMHFYNNIEPSVLLSYDREAFFDKYDSDFRITFDDNILMRDYDLSLTKGIYGTDILQKGTVLMEVKTAMGMPKWLLEFLSENNIYKTSFSKYGNAYTKILLPKRKGGFKNVA